MSEKSKYIYLDTNVISEFKKLSLDDWRAFRNAQRKYYVPFSHAHLFDLSNSPIKYLKTDIELLEKITNSEGIYPNKSGDMEINKLNASLFDFYESVIKQRELDKKEALKNIFQFVPGYEQFPVNTDVMHENSFLYEMVVKNNGIIDGNFPNLILNQALNGINSHQTYNSLRKQIQDIIAHTKKYGTYKKTPEGAKLIFDIFSLEHEEYSDELFQMLEEYLRISGRISGNNYDSKNTPNKIIKVYLLLDLVKGYSEKISKKNSWKNMFYDAQHCANAWQANFLVTNEKNNNTKVDFIKEQFNLKFNLISLSELIHRFKM